MTREEKLDWLYRLKSEIYVYMPKDWLIPMNDALDMAIEELNGSEKPKSEVNEFIDYAIKERCEGCTECDPKCRNVQEAYCVEQGFAQWLMYTGERWQQARKRSAE